MFAGLYGLAFAAKRFAPARSLAWFFVAVQFLNLVFAVCILIGLEHAKVVPHYLPASWIVYYDFPWSHALLMAFAWAWLTFRLSKSPIVATCVFLQWPLDVIVHFRDLPLYRGSVLFGLGLWRFREATFAIEVVLLLAGLMVYLQATRPRSSLGQTAPLALAALIIVLEGIRLYAPIPANMRLNVALAVAVYSALAAAAFWADSLREPLPPEPDIRLDLAAT